MNSYELRSVLVHPPVITLNFGFHYIGPTNGEAAIGCFESMYSYYNILHSKPQLIFLLILDPDNSLTCDCRLGARRRDSAPLTPTQEVFITLILSVTRDLETVTLNHTQFCVSLSSQQFVSN